MCSKCQQVPVSEEFQRCAECQKAHEELIKTLDARPKPIKKPKEEFIEIKSVKRYQNPDGTMREVEFTDYHSKSDWIRSGNPLPK